MPHVLLNSIVKVLTMVSLNKLRPLIRNSSPLGKVPNSSFVSKPSWVPKKDVYVNVCPDMNAESIGISVVRIVPKFWPSSRIVILLTLVGIGLPIRSVFGCSGKMEHMLSSIPELGRLVSAQVWPRANTKVYVLGKQAHWSTPIWAPTGPKRKPIRAKDSHGKVMITAGIIYIIAVGTTLSSSLVQQRRPVRQV
jgi:hypothetical protein